MASDIAPLAFEVCLMKNPPSPPEDPNNPAAPLPLPELVEESSFLRQIIFERRFRIAVTLLFALTVFLALFLPKWWITSPPGFLPVIHTSGLDKVQSWALRRSAQKRFQEGMLEEAVHAWRMAILEDPCNPVNSRGFIQMLIDAQPPMTAQLGLGFSQSQWLLRLNRTNRQDSILVAHFCDRYRYYPAVVSLLSPQMQSLAPSEADLLLRAFFHQGELEAFQELWLHSPASHTNAILQVYHAAWQVGWGPPGGIRQARDQLDKAKKEPALMVVAHSLELALSFARSEPDRYAESLHFLEREHLDLVVDHASYWRLLIRAGRSGEAQKLARLLVTPPTTPQDCLAVADVLNVLGHPKDAAEYIAKYLAQLGGYLELWVRRAEYTIAAADWERLRDVAIEMRQVDVLRDSAGGFAWYLEGLSELKRNRAATADNAFAAMIKAPLTDPLLGFRTAQAIAELGRPELARQLLDRLSSSFGNSAEYWLQVELAAYGSDDIEGMLAAAEKAYQLAPQNPTIVNNYAAALIIMRQRPAEAVKLTLNSLAQHPQDEGSKLNHALALLQNQRLNEAQAVLTTLDPSELTGLYHTVYQLAVFELHYLKGDREKALDSASKIEARFLKPPQVRWLDGVVKTLKQPKG